MTVIRLTIQPEPVPNDARLEWLFSAVEGKPPAAQKRLIVQAGMEGVGFLDPEQTAIALDALGLRDA